MAGLLNLRLLEISYICAVRAEISKSFKFFRIKCCEVSSTPYDILVTNELYQLRNKGSSEKV